jgi:hypothetical protein
MDPLVDSKQNLAQLRQITDQSEWITLVPPTCESTDPAWNMEPFTLRRWQQHDPDDPKSIWLWTAALEFVQEGETGNRITFQLDFNPVFVSLSACSLPVGETVHRVHRRELDRYKTKHVSVSGLMHFEPRADDRDEVVVIKATAPGAEVVARAWCAQYRTAAIIRKAGGACFSCAVKAASQYGLRVEVLIWVS